MHDRISQHVVIEGEIVFSLNSEMRYRRKISKTYARKYLENLVSITNVIDIQYKNRIQWIIGHRVNCRAW